ncbi:MAG: MMPL family transporter [bacterium]
MSFESFMARFTRGLFRYRWWILSLILLITAGLAYSTRHLEVNNDYDTWLPARDRIAEMYRIVDRQFSANALVFVVLDFSDKGVFHPDSLALVQRMTRELESIKDLFNVTSLTNIVDIRRADSGIEIRDLIPEIPGSDSELRALEEYVLSKEMYVNAVISPDAAFTVVICNIDSQAEEVAAAGAILDRIHEVAAGRPYYFGGDPALIYYLDLYQTRDMELLVPLTLLAMVIILGYGLRNLWGVVLSLSLVVLSVIWTFGLQVLFEMPSNVLTPAVVVLLIAMGSEYAVHFYNHFLRRGDLALTSSEIAMPIIMSAATTIVGVLTFATTRIDILNRFGIELAFGLGSACLLSLVLLPICMQLVKAKPNLIHSTAADRPDFLSDLLDRLGGWAHRHTRRILVVSSIGLLILGSGIPRITSNVDFVELLPEESPPRRGNDILRDHFSGIYSVAMYFKGDIEDPAVMGMKEYVENFMRSEELLSSFTSINGLLAEENWLMNGVFAVPETREGIANLWLLLEGEEILKTFVTPDRTQALVTGLLREPQTYVMWHVSQLLRDFLNENVSGEIVRIDPQRLSPEGRESLKDLRLREAARQIAWLAQGYDKPARYDFLPILERMKAELGRVDDTISLEPVWAASRSYLQDEAVEAVPPEVIERILAVMQESGADIRDTALAGRIARTLTSPQVMAPEDALETASGVLRRAESVLRLERAAALGRPLRDLFSAELAQHKDFHKRTEGVIWGLWAERPFFFSRQVRAVPGIETAVVARKPVEVDQAGAPDLLRRFDELLYESQIQSLLLASLAVLILISATQRSIRRGLASLLSVLAPLVAVLGFMGWAGIPLDFGTVLYGALVIGLGVDGSIHFLTYQHRQQLAGVEPEAAFRETSRHVGRAVATANGTICCAFLMLLLSQTTTLRYFALVNSLAILLVTLSMLTILPALVSLFQIDRQGSPGKAVPHRHDLPGHSVQEGGRKTPSRG